MHQQICREGVNPTQMAQLSSFLSTRFFKTKKSDYFYKEGFLFCQQAPWTSAILQQFRRYTQSTGLGSDLKVA